MKKNKKKNGKKKWEDNTEIDKNALFWKAKQQKIEIAENIQCQQTGYRLYILKIEKNANGQ